MIVRTGADAQHGSLAYCFCIGVTQPPRSFKQRAFCILLDCQRRHASCAQPGELRALQSHSGQHVQERVGGDGGWGLCVCGGVLFRWTKRMCEMTPANDMTVLSRASMGTVIPEILAPLVWKMQDGVEVVISHPCAKNMSEWVHEIFFSLNASFQVTCPWHQQMETQIESVDRNLYHGAEEYKSTQKLQWIYNCYKTQKPSAFLFKDVQPIVPSQARLAWFITKHFLCQLPCGSLLLPPWSVILSSTKCLELSKGLMEHYKVRQ